MNSARAALRLYHDGARFLQIKGEVTLDVAKIEPALLQRAVAAVKRGFGTASQGPTQKLLSLVARKVGYNENGFPFVSWGHVTMYFPKAAAGEFHDVSDAIQTLMTLEGSTVSVSGSYHYKPSRNEGMLLFSQSAPSMTNAQRKRLRRFIKDQSAKWRIYRQPMLDFLNDRSRTLVWYFDSEYKGDSKP